MPFDSPDVNLGILLADAASGKSQLPDFQREWKWSTDQIGSLLASISLGYPVGIVMMLEVGGEGVKFLPRVIAGVELAVPRAPELLILDGQQRITSLYQSLLSGRPVETKDGRGRKLRRWYYISMNAALDAEADREEAIIAVPEDRVLRDDFGREVIADYSSTERECHAEMFPLLQVFDQASTDRWMYAYLQLDPPNMPARLARWSEFSTRILNGLKHYTVPVIILKKETPKEAVCTVFEKVNTGGVPLNVFELLTATFAADDFRLNDDWKRRRERLAKHPVLRSVENTDFLQSVCLLGTRARREAHLKGGGDVSSAPGISCKRKEVLRLTLADYQTWAEPLTEALEWAASFLSGERIFQDRDLPYRTQLVPLAAIRVALGMKAETIGVVARLRQWYWCGVLGELYGGTTETRFARDLADVVAWIDGGPIPTTIQEAGFSPNRLLTLRTRNAAAYKGIYALLMRGGCKDWIYDKAIDLASFFNHKLDIHHVFPKRWCEEQKIDDRRRESIVNKTAISFSTNRFIGGRAPSAYLPALEKRAGVGAAELQVIVATHKIDPTLLRADDFVAFFERRAAALLDLIAEAMGKPILEQAAGPEEWEEEVDEPEDEVANEDPDVETAG